MIALACCLAVALLVMPSPFFGTQAVRLLRETWVSATELAEELFAMLDDSVPQTQNAPVTMNAQPNAVPLTINNPLGGHGIVLNGGDISIAGGGGFNLDGGNISVTDGDILINGVPVGTGGGGGGGGGGGTTVVTTAFLGKVVSGSGDTYTLNLYGNGSGAAATATVTATVPQIDGSETIPPGTWVSPVFRFTNGGAVTYEFQPPVWLI